MNITTFLGQKLKTNAAVRRLIKQKSVTVNGVLAEENTVLQDSDFIKVGKKSYHFPGPKQAIIDALEPLCIHPAAHSRFVPIDLVNRYQGKNVAFGSHVQTGWFVLEKLSDGRKVLCWSEKQIPEGFAWNPSPESSEQFKTHTWPYPDDVMLYSRASLGALLGAKDTEPLKQLTIDQPIDLEGPSGAVFVVTRIGHNLYKLTN